MSQRPGDDHDRSGDAWREEMLRWPTSWAPQPYPTRRRSVASTLRAIGRAIQSLIMIALMLVGLPAGLIIGVGWPLPTREEFIRWLERPPDTTPLNSDETLFQFFACLMWLVWAAFVWFLLAEAIRVILRIRLPRPRVPAPLRRPVTTLVSGLMLASTIARTTVPSPAPAVASADVGKSQSAEEEEAEALAGPSASTPVSSEASQDVAEPHVAAPPIVPVGQVTLLVAGQRYAHTVVRGDTLSEIAETWLGDANRWPEIYHLNRGRSWPSIGGRLHDPDLIFPGWTLELPADAAPPGGPVPPAPTAPTPGSPAPTASAEPDSAPIGPPRVETSPPAVAPAKAGEVAAQDHQPGVRLPSQTWVSLGLATSIAAIAALIRLRRRQLARLTFPIPTSLAPAPSPVPASLRALDAAGSLDLLLDSGDDAPLPGIMPLGPPVSAPIGFDTDGQEVSLFDLPEAGIGLCGEGTEAVARAIIAAALATGIVEYQCDRPIVVIPVGLLARLLPTGAPLTGLNPDYRSYDPERLCIVADTEAAIVGLEEEMVRRRREVDRCGVATLDDLREQDIGEYSAPHVTIVEAEQRHVARLRAITACGRGLHLTTVVLGDGGPPPTYGVRLDGTITASPPDPDDQSRTALAGRLSTLGQRDLVDVLGMVEEAAPRPEQGTDVERAQHPTAETAKDPVDVLRVPDPPNVSGEQKPVRLAVLGPVTVTTVASGRLTAGLRTGSASVLAMLAVHPEGRSLDQIAIPTRPETDRDAARASTRTDISAARTLLRQTTGLAKAKFILFDGARYLLDRNLVNVDLWDMLAAIDQANHAADDTACLAALRRAADCHGGSFAVTVGRVWVAEYATTIRNQVLSVHGRIAEFLEADHPDQAIAVLERAIEHDPVNEELYQRVMRIHGRLGRSDAVRRTVRLLGNRIAELGEAEVSETTERLAHRLIEASTKPRRPVPIQLCAEDEDFGLAPGDL
ncbi:MAG: LysM peptidoglycan-binding domain-containing protein [Dactylosporangium sp.]|nr:LysM peptidoglycan-binding domain-containing protein [Dactylosporangium sp.]NNJ60177.1 LysM peptidoglycan-binding domain-containing protein [Dactylosporangium sp.]